MTDKAKSVVRYLVCVFSDPILAFTGVAEGVSSAPGFTAQIVLSVASTLVLLPATMATLAESLYGVGAPSDFVATTKWVSMGTSLFFALVLPFVQAFFIAMLLMFIGQFYGGGVKLSNYIAMLGYARIPVALGGLVQSIVTLRLPSIEQAGNVSLSLGVFAPDGAGSALRAFLSSVNPFAIWYLLLISIGFASLHRIKPQKAAGVATTVYLVGLLIAIIGFRWSGRFGASS